MLLTFCVQVTSIDYTSEQVKVQTASGDELVCTKVLVTVPLTVLQKRVIKFTPPMPTDKQSAIDQIGIGQVEKVS